jgi:alkylated DNA repair dioxygenase AlkB
MQQLNLFNESAPVLPITYYPNFLSLEQANSLYQHCLQLEWQQNQIRMAGKTIPVPRLECLYGDKGCDYLYSNGVFLKPLTEQFAIMEEFGNLFIWDTEQIISIMEKINTYYQYSEQAHLWVG